MARMIPPEVYPSCSSAGERDVFSKLKGDPLAKSWIVLHSLNLAHHKRQTAGEIDFVVIVPGKGVLCIEVKGCSVLHRQNGMWYYGPDAKGDARGPFKQAFEAMHSIRTRLTRQCLKVGHIPFWSAVIFPYIEFSVSSPEWHSWQVIDSTDLGEHSIGALLTRTLENARCHLASSSAARWFEPNREHPTPDECLLLLNLLRPSFEVFESPGKVFQRITSELKQYTEEQFEALDAMENNTQVLFNGPAGTGKTLLAIEAAKRAHAAGRRTLFLCFNRNLGRWLRNELSSLEPLIMVRTLHSFMLETSGTQQVPDDLGSDFWQEVLPKMCLASDLRGPYPSLPFDEIIIDEAQDIMRDNYIPVLDMVLKGGLQSGRYRMFGDFEKQTIFGPVDSAKINTLKNNGCAEYNLRVNCRNLPRIASLANLLGGLDPDYRRVRRPDDGARSEPLYKFYADKKNQERLLIESIQSLLDDGFHPADFVVLSPKNERDCLAGQVRQNPWNSLFSTLESANIKHIRYTSVHAFKGLEAPIIVLTDIESLASAQDEGLFYIAVTRALHRLVIFIADSAKPDILRALDKKVHSGESYHVNTHC